MCDISQYNLATISPVNALHRLIFMREALTYDDVLLVPKRSPVKSRKEVNISTRLSKSIRLNIPLISANMDSVTESAMAIAMAREGGLGIIHQFMPIEDEVKEVLKVKRSENIIVEKPYTIGPEKTLREVKEVLEESGVKSLIVVDSSRKLLGMLTRRDILFEEDENKKVEELMTKRSDLVTAPFGIGIEDAKVILKNNRIEKLPLVDEKGDLKGLITAKDIIKSADRPMTSKDIKGRLLVGAAVGVKEGYLERAGKLIEAGCDLIVVDIAHAHSDLAINAIRNIRKEFGNAEIMAGNIATSEAAQDLISAGADSLKVGVGPGSSCITRIVTGAGMPQLTAVMDVAKVANPLGIPVVADGGLRTSGDVVKALAAGASTGFSGFLFAGTEETPGITMIKEGRKYKIYRGSASFGMALTRKGRENKDDINPFDYIPEGVEATVPYKGSVAEIIKGLIGGIKSGISYCGGTNVQEMQKNAEFVKITQSGIKESGYHDINRV